MTETHEAPTLALIGVYDDRDPAEPPQTQPAGQEREPVASGADAELLDRIRAANVTVTERQREVEGAENEVDGAKAHLKHAEKRRDESVADLQSVIEEREQPVLQFPAPDATPAPSGAWRDHPIAALDLTAAVVTKLAEFEFVTVGHLADWTSDDKQLTEIRGIGKATADKIDEALLTFWAAHPEYAQPATPEFNGNFAENH